MTARISALLVTAVALAIPVQAATLQALLDSDDLRVRVYPWPPDNIVVRQEVRIVIEVATTSWFARGTQFQIPEIDDVVVKQRDKFAANSTLRDGADTWAVQRWERSLFPQTEGEISFPGLDLGLAVGGAYGGLVTGTLKSDPLTFAAIVPTPMRALAQNWFAAEAFTVEQSFDKPPSELLPGDAITQTVVLRAERVLAMMLPAFRLAPVAGVAAYPKTPELLDYGSRGAATAERRQDIVYVLEAPGPHELPAQQIIWWNSVSSRLETTLVQPVVLGAGSPNNTGIAEAAELGRTLRCVIAITAVAALLGLLVAGVARVVRSRRTKTASMARAAAAAGDFPALCRWLYAWLDEQRGATAPPTLRAFANAQGPAAVSEADSVLHRTYAAEGSLATPTVDTILAVRRAGPRLRVQRLIRPMTLSLEPAGGAF